MDTQSNEHSALEALLRENLEVAKENNQILKDMRRIGRIAFWSKVVIWTLVIVLPLLFIGPILSSFSAALTPAGGSSVLGLPSADLFREAFDIYTGQE